MRVVLSNQVKGPFGNIRIRLEHVKQGIFVRTYQDNALIFSDKCTKPRKAILKFYDAVHKATHAQKAFGEVLSAASSVAS